MVRHLSLVVMNQKGAEQILNGKTKLGGNAAAAVGPTRGQLRLNQRNHACQLQVDHHLNAPVELEEHRRAFC